VKSMVGRKNQADGDRCPLPFANGNARLARARFAACAVPHKTAPLRFIAQLLYQPPRRLPLRSARLRCWRCIRAARRPRTSAAARRAPRAAALSCRCCRTRALSGAHQRAQRHQHVAVRWRHGGGVKERVNEE
jgi:hypothetical protein